jgi:hypothetical protein
MKTSFPIMISLVAVLATFFTGCSQSDTTSPPAETARPAAGQPPPVVENAPKAAGVSSNAQEAAAKMTDTSAQIQTIIDGVKSLIAANNYQQASAALNGLKSFNLTPEQQKSVDDLKKEIQQHLSSEAAKGAANLLGK